LEVEGMSDYTKEQAELKAFGQKIDDAESHGRPDAAQALRDVEDAIRAANNLRAVYGVGVVETAQLILDESRIWRHEHGFRRRSERE
jgi:hypothetical protein